MVKINRIWIEESVYIWYERKSSNVFLKVTGYFFFYYSKMVHFLFSFLTLCLCFQYFHNDLLLFNKESALDPVADTFSTHGTTTGSADMFLRFRQPHENFWSHSTNASKSAWVHTTCRFWCFPNLLGIKVNNSITRGSGRPGFVEAVL